MARTRREILLDEATTRLGTLDADRLKAANDFLAYLQERTADAETAEVMSIPGILDDIREALVDLESGKVVRFEEIRRDV